MPGLVGGEAHVLVLALAWAQTSDQTGICWRSGGRGGGWRLPSWLSLHSLQGPGSPEQSFYMRLAAAQEPLLDCPALLANGAGVPGSPGSMVICKVVLGLPPGAVRRQPSEAPSPGSL